MLICFFLLFYLSSLPLPFCFCSIVVADRKPCEYRHSSWRRCKRDTLAAGTGELVDGSAYRVATSDSTDVAHVACFSSFFGVRGGERWRRHLVVQRGHSGAGGRRPKRRRIEPLDD